MSIVRNSYPPETETDGSIVFGELQTQLLGARKVNPLEPPMIAVFEGSR